MNSAKYPGVYTDDGENYGQLVMIYILAMAPNLKEKSVRLVCPKH